MPAQPASSDPPSNSPAAACATLLSGPQCKPAMLLRCTARGEGKVRRNWLCTTPDCNPYFRPRPHETSVTLELPALADAGTHRSSCRSAAACRGRLCYLRWLCPDGLCAVFQPRLGRVCCCWSRLRCNSGLGSWHSDAWRLLGVRGVHRQRCRGRVCERPEADMSEPLPTR